MCAITVLSCYLLYVAIALDSKAWSQSIKDPQNLTSNNGVFTLGFFTPQNSTNRYVGIWCRSLLVWVANRNQPLHDSSGVVTVHDDGNLVLLNGQRRVIWSSNLTNIKSNSTFQLSDYGNLMLLENRTGDTLWESFKNPSDALLPGMTLTADVSTAQTLKLASWKSPSDPSSGSFYMSLERPDVPEAFVRDGSRRPYWRSGPWNGSVFMGIQTMGISYLFGFHLINSGGGEVDLSLTLNQPGLLVYILRSEGVVLEKSWDEEHKEWQETWTSQNSDCDVYGTCGAFGICDPRSSPICNCLQGFEPRNRQEWNARNWTGGCVRVAPLWCERAEKNPNATAEDKAEGFLMLQSIKVPDFTVLLSVEQEDQCRRQCLKNCSCVAYSYNSVIGCMSWNDNLTDLQQFASQGATLHVRVANTDLGSDTKPVADKGKHVTVIVTFTVIIGTLVFVASAFIAYRRVFKHKGWERIRKQLVFKRFKKGETSEEYTSGDFSQSKLQEIVLFNIEKLASATNNFNLSNKLGQGGFGPVYKGELQGGQEIAVKRLSRASGQGLQEFVNEVELISKLQHRNLVRLLGCCTEGGEKMLIYEYMPNGSLDAFIFDTPKGKLMDWRKRFTIIEGIARGLLYLHRDSRLKIIHRDMKASNILLDEELNPKISDFGMARIFGGNEDQANTTRVVGTYGYMSPEYAMHGFFSEKSDVFSFGVLLLEIISGRRNSSFYDNDHALSLLGFVWLQWRGDNILSLIDPAIYLPEFHNNILRCIQIGLLCVQEHAVDRPNMATVISMLNSEIAELPPPTQSAFILRENMLSAVSSTESHRLFSVNNVSITSMQGR